MDVIKTKDQAIEKASNKEKCLLCAVRFWNTDRLMFLLTCKHIICTNCFTRRFKRIDGLKSNCPSCNIEFENKDVLRIRSVEVIWMAAEKDYSRYASLSQLLHLEDVVFLNKKCIPANVYEEHYLLGHLPLSKQIYFMNSLKLSNYHLPVWSRVGSKPYPSREPGPSYLLEYPNLQYSMSSDCHYSSSFSESTVDQYAAIQSEGQVYYYPIPPVVTSYHVDTTSAYPSNFNLYTGSLNQYQSSVSSRNSPPIRKVKDYIFDCFTIHDQAHRFKWTHDSVVKQYPTSIFETKEPTYSLIGVADYRPRDLSFAISQFTPHPPSNPVSVLQYPPTHEEILAEGTDTFVKCEKRNYPTGTDLGAASRRGLVVDLNYPPSILEPAFMEFPMLNLSAMSSFDKQQIWTCINRNNTASHLDTHGIINSARTAEWFDVFFQYVPSYITAEDDYVYGIYRFYYLLSDLCIVKPNSGLDRMFHSSDDLLWSINNEYRLLKTLYYS